MARRFSRSASRYSGAPAGMNVRGGVSNFNRSYKSEGAGIRRHQVISTIAGLDSIALGDTATATICRFKRSFDATADGEPTPTASNNFQSFSVMNGSKIQKLTAKIKINNQGSATGIYLDVYEVVTSFSDALFMETTYPAESPVTYDSGVDIDSQGEVSFSGNAFTENIYKNFKGIQRNMRFLGTMYMTSEDGGTPSAEFMIQGAPPKCRRSQTGMMYGLVFNYSSTKNTTALATMDASIEVNFEELPASNRIPYKW